MPSWLFVPGTMGERRKSEGCIATQFMSNTLHREREQDHEKKVMEPKTSNQMSDVNREVGSSTGRLTFNTSNLDRHLIEVLRENYDIVSALADIDVSEAPEKEQLGRPNTPMKGPVPRNTTGSPKPLILRQHNGYKGNELESTSISSTDTVSDVEAESSWETIKKEIRWFLLDIVEALESPRNNGTESTHDTGKLSAVALKKDLKRCYNFLHPFLEVAAALYDTLLWKTPINTLLLALVYMYSIVRGWTASLVLLLLLLQLSLNYLKAIMHIDIGLNFLPRKDVTMPRFDISGAQLIFAVAKIAQKLLNFSANFLEKLHSLLTWKEVRVTVVFYCLVIYWLTLSLIFNTGTCLGMCGITLGVRIFITTYLFDRFPRLRYRLDTFGWFYRNLPIKNTAPSSHSFLNGVNIDGINSDRSLTPSSGHRNPGVISGLFSSRLGSNFDLDQGSMQNLHTLSNKAHSASNLPLLSEESNAHLPGGGPSFVNLSSYSGEDEEYEDSSAEDDPMIDNVVAFRSCVMNDKAKMFPKGITSGILYLTDSALIFRSRSANEDTASVMLLFTDIISTKKIQSLRSMSIIAGTRKSLEITISGRRKPVQFIGIAKRDDFVQRMESMCVQAQAKVYFID